MPVASNLPVYTTDQLSASFKVVNTALLIGAMLGNLPGIGEKLLVNPDCSLPVPGRLLCARQKLALPLKYPLLAGKVERSQ